MIHDLHEGWDIRPTFLSTWFCTFHFFLPQDICHSFAGHIDAWKLNKIQTEEVYVTLQNWKWPGKWAKTADCGPWNKGVGLRFCWLSLCTKYHCDHMDVKMYKVTWLIEVCPLMSPAGWTQNGVSEHTARLVNAKNSLRKACLFECQLLQSAFKSL